MSFINQPLKIRELELKNRAVMSPMCQYSSVNGYANEWHFSHYTARAVGGVGAVIQEATAVVPEGRISYMDMGLWEDGQIANLKKIVSYVSGRGTVPGIQLAHAGRKASCDVPWVNRGAQIKEGPNSWRTYAPSALAFDEGDLPPVEMTGDDIKRTVKAFKDATLRALEAGFRIIELHAAHGYLINEFLSPLTNRRTDEYGGSFENRIRFLLEIVEAVSGLIDERHSLWVRISATDWVEGGWDVADSARLAAVLRTKGVDLVDCSSGGVVPHVKIPVGPCYQAFLAERVKQESGILTGAVGLITAPEEVEELLGSGKCDLVLLGRILLREPYFVMNSLKKAGVDIIPPQYKLAYPR